MSGTAPAGWYPDGSGALRWWDGAGWTAHVAATPPAPLAAPAPEPVLQHSLPDGAPAARSAYDAVALTSWSDPSARVAPAAVSAPAATTTWPAALPASGYASAPAARVAPAGSGSGLMGGALLLVSGLALLALGVAGFLYARSHGYFSGVGLVSGSILAVRGILQIRESRRSGLPLTLSLPSPRTIGVLAVVGLLIIGGIALAVRAGSGPRPLVDAPMASTAAGAWPVGYTAVGTDAAYRRLDTVSEPCPPGNRCSEILVLSRTACRLPQLDITWLDAGGRPLNVAGGIGFQNSGPDVPATTLVWTPDPAAASYTITRFLCHD